MEHSFSIGTARVRWDNTLSDPVPLTAGVRWGPISLTFSAYIDVVQSELGKLKSGCYINGKYFNSFLYADDLLLLSISVADLQLLIDKCLHVFGVLDLQINAQKFNCLRIGTKFRAHCKSIIAED